MLPATTAIEKKFDFEEVLGYSAVDFEGDTASMDSLMNFYPYISTVSSFAYRIDTDGELHGEIPQEELLAAREKGVTLVPLIHNFEKTHFSSQTAESVLGTEKSRKKLSLEIVELLEQFRFTGVNIDIENIPPKQRENYSQFLRELKAAFEPQDYTLIVSVPAKTKDDTESGWSGAFDYQAVGRYADRVQLMTYDEHWFDGNSGPIASIEWVESVVGYALETIPKEKILLGVAAYGYNWGDDGECTVIRANEVQALTEKYGGHIEWDEKSLSPFYQYTDDKGVNHIVWFEDARSAMYKFELAEQKRLAGIALWRLGFEEALFWKRIAQRKTAQ